ncbi:MAG: MarR family winged helix-turn-helix transcriptional regulator [Atopobiaceae bacterium]
MEREERGSRKPTVRDIDILYRESDRLYYELARGCGLSDAAYWVLYEIVYNGGVASQRSLAQAFALSRQTVNTAIKSLEAKGLVKLEFEEGSRKCKDVLLTDAGRAFCDEKLVPAMEAESRAFEALSEHDREEFVRLVGTYAEAIDREIEKMRNDRKEDVHD